MFSLYIYIYIYVNLVSIQVSSKSEQFYKSYLGTFFGDVFIWGFPRRLLDTFWMFEVSRFQLVKIEV